MKKNVYTLFLILFTVPCAWAQTFVDGGIFTPETWTPNGNPYIVMSNIVVFPGASLTLQPGVEVRFGADVKLELRAGNLYANGTAEAPITFTLDSDDPIGAPKWAGIENTSGPNENIDLELNHVILEYAETAINYGDGYALKSVSNAIIRYNDRGLYDGAEGYNWVTVSDTEFLENGVGMEGRMSVLNSTFRNNMVGFGNPLTFQDINSGGRVINCEFIENDLAIGSLGQVITIAIIEQSTFTDNGRGFDGYWTNIDASTFSGSSSFAVSAQKGEIQNSSFSENGIGFQVAIFNNELSVHDNSFINNTVGLEIGSAGAAIFDNTICNNMEAAAKLTTDQAVDLNNNCWCTTNLNEIASRVIDAYDDVTLGIASYDEINIGCIGGDVFPGDANNNQVVNAWDILPIGITFGSIGPTRPMSNDWSGESAENWSWTLPNSVNSKHADCNGDGIVDMEDLSWVETHYGNTHNALAFYQPMMSNTEALKLQLESVDPLVPGQQVTIEVTLSDASQPIDDLYGIAFALASEELDFSKVATTVSLNDSWLGNSTNLMQINKAMMTGQLEIGMVKNDLQASAGYGAIATIEFMLPADFPYEDLSLQAVDIEAVTSQGLNLMIENEEMTTFTTSNQEISNVLNDQIRLFPNPASEVVFLAYDGLEIKRVELLDINGKVIAVQNGYFNGFPVNAKSGGMYFLKIQTDQGISVKRFLIQE